MYRRVSVGQAAGSIFLAGLLIGHIHMSEKMCPPDKSSPSGGLIHSVYGGIFLIMCLLQGLLAPYYQERIRMPG